MQTARPLNLTEPRIGRAGTCPGLGLGAVLGLAGALGLALTLGLAPSARAATPAGTLEVEALTGAPSATPPCTMDQPGRLRGRLFGALTADLDWTGPTLRCDGMPRPAGEGLRLFFSHPLDGNGQLALVLGIDGEPTAAGTREWPVTVTVIAEGQGKFFSSAGQQRCWARIDGITRLGGEPAARRIDGMVFCVGSLPSLNDLDSVTLVDLEFSGRVTDDD